MQAAVAFGANLGEPREMFSNVTPLIVRELGALLSSSKLYETAPLLLSESSKAQPNYFNAVLLLETSLEPEQILQRLLQIEAQMGRDRIREHGRWEPRLIDLDLIFVDSLVRETSELILPHPEMHKRGFVLRPLCDIAPSWKHPLLGKTVRRMLSELTQDLIIEGH